MTFEETKCKGVFIITPEVIGDARGFLMEVYHSDKFATHGIPTDFQQCHHSRSAEGVLRGLHFQYDPPAHKLIRALKGKIFAAAADIRIGSPTFGQWVGVELSEENKKMLYVPAGFASGFCVIEEGSEAEYHWSAVYTPGGESNIVWNDPTLNISWPVKDPILSPRDAGANTLELWLSRPESKLFTY